jgi:manganese/zinc/iron transport system permease protein
VAVPEIIWMTFDTWIVAIGALTAAACALPGALLLLNRQSMMGDAISHAVLPGIVVVWMLAGTLHPLVLLAGALATAIASTWLIDWLGRRGGLEEGAAMGVTFTALFALGLILVRRFADRVHLDVDHVLYGSIELAPLHTVTVAGIEMPRAALLAIVMLVVNAVLTVAFLKELRLYTFDCESAEVQGYPVKYIRHGLMVVTAATMIVAFEAVGSILVLALLVLPAATARLICNRFATTLVMAALVAMAGAALGHPMALLLPPLVGFEDSSTSGMMVVSSSLLLGFALVWRAVADRRARRARSPAGDFPLAPSVREG